MQILIEQNADPARSLSAHPIGRYPPEFVIPARPRHCYAHDKEMLKRSGKAVIAIAGMALALGALQAFQNLYKPPAAV